MMPRALTLCSSLLMACGGTSAAEARPAVATAASAMTLSDALARAEAELTGTQPFEVEYEDHDGARVIEVEVLVGSDVREVYYDPASGTVVHDATETPEADEAAAIPTLTAEIGAGHVSLRQALDLANATYEPTSIEAAELAVDAGAVVVWVLVQGADGMTRYVHDVVTGALRSSAPASPHVESTAAM